MERVIKNFCGDVFHLTNEVYKIGAYPRKKGVIKPSDYPPGTLVRLISGIDNNQTPGYHFFEGWKTVCRVDAEIAEFVGFPEKQLKLISQ